MRFVPFVIGLLILSVLMAGAGRPGLVAGRSMVLVIGGFIGLALLIWVIATAY